MLQVHDTASTTRASDFFKGITGFAAAQNILILTTQWRVPGPNGYSKAEKDERDRQERAYEQREGALANFKFILERGASIMKCERGTCPNSSLSRSSSPSSKRQRSSSVRQKGTDKPASQSQPAPDAVTNPQDVLQAFVEKPSVALLIQQETIDQRLKLKETAGGSTANADIKFRIKEAELNLRQAERSLRRYMRGSMDSVKSIPASITETVSTSAVSAVNATAIMATTITTTVNATITATVNATMSAAGAVTGSRSMSRRGSKQMPVTKAPSRNASRAGSRNITPCASPVVSVTALPVEEKDGELEVKQIDEKELEKELEKERREREMREMEKAVEEARHHVERHKKTRDELALRVEESPKGKPHGLSRLKDILVNDSDH
jgi:hypothetical protein